MKLLAILTAMTTACPTTSPTSTDEQQVCTIEDQEIGQCVTPLLLASTRQYSTSAAPDGTEYAWACHSYNNGVNSCSVVLYTPAGDLMVSCTNVGTCAVTPCGPGEDLSCDP
jgi:hypothetical protein